jgi:hypothetical protein
LWQKRDVYIGQNSHLILGDSFTEGQGAIPWFYKLEAATPTHGYQLVNGGILGTGPLQWELLKNHLVAEYKLELERVLLIMIGADIVRRVWNFHPHGMRCLKTARCEKALGDFYGYEFGQKSDDQIKQEILTMHKSADRTIVVDQGLKYGIKRLIKKSAFIYRLYISIKEFSTARLELNNVHSKYDANLAAMERMLLAGKKLGKVMIVPTLIEIDDSDTIKWDQHSRYFFNWAEKKNVAFEICRLTREDYHKHDAHPNEEGYEKILKCVSAILKN